MKNLFTILLLMIAFSLLTSCGKEKQGPVQEILKPVKYAPVVQEGGEIIKTFNGTSQSGAETNLSFRTNGLIVKLNVKVGENVKSGSLLAQLDLSDIQLNKQKAEAALQSAKSQVETARSSFERTKELYQSNSASLNDYEQTRNNYSTAQSNYENSRKSLQLQTRQLDYAKIVAPTDGTVSAVNADINEFVSAGSPIIIINSDQKDIEVSIGVTESYISKIKNGDKAAITFTAIPGKTFSGIVSEVGFASAQTATSPVVLKLIDVSGEMRPGMPVEVSFSFGDKNEKSTLSVPVSAVGQDQEGFFVYILKPMGKKVFSVAKTVIKTGKLSNSGYQVLSGINEGDLVATAGLRSLYDGMKVKLLN